MKPLLPFILFVLVGSFSANAKKIDTVDINPINNTQVVDVSGNYAIVGMPFYKDLTAADKTGGAYIFFKDALGWKMQAKLTAPDITDADLFGSAVAIYGDYCVVGSSEKTIGTQQKQGKIYIYKRTGNTWNLESTEIATTGNSGDQFGYSVDISMNSANTMVIAVGAPGASNNKGRVYTYARNNTKNTWSCSQIIAPLDLTNNNRFGQCVSIDKDDLAIGAPNQDYAVYDIIDAGAVYVFTSETGAFIEQQKLVGYSPDEEFGQSLTLAGNKLAISSSVTNNDDNNKSTASVFVLKRTGFKWDDTFSDLVTLHYGNKDNTRFGLRLSIDANQLFVGSTSNIISISTVSNPTISNSPCFAYLYLTNDGGDTYHLKQTITNPTSFPNNFDPNVAFNGLNNPINK